MNPSRTAALVGLVGLLAVGLAPAPAAAAPPPSPNQAYWSDDSHLHYVGGISKANNVVISDHPTRLNGLRRFLIDDVGTIVPGLGCVNVAGDNTKVVCTEQEDSISWFTVSLGMLDDTLLYTANFDTYVDVSGGTGDDTLTFGADAGAYVDVTGDAGTDVITRAAGTSYLRIDGGTGADTMCATGAWISYENHPAGVFVTVGGPVGDDGTPGEGDTVCADSRNVIGTDFADGLVGGAAGVRFYGQGGGDVLVGTAGEDIVSGGTGTDTIYGYAADDWLAGGAGADKVYAGTGVDRCELDGGDTLSSCEDIY